jgi:hypothetical protein
MEVRRVSDLSVMDDSDDGPATESDEESRA